MIDLIELAAEYAACRDISAGHADQLIRHARLYGGGLSADELNADLKRLRQSGHSDSYCRNRKQYVLLLWRFAAARDLVPDPPMSKIMRVRIKDHVPRGYSSRDVGLLIAAAGLLRGIYSSGVLRAAWWTSYIAAAWDTGLATCDMLTVCRSWINDDATMTTVRKKTGRRVAVAFHKSTIKMIDETFPPGRELIWPLTVSRESMRITFRKIATKAGVGGTLKWLRAGSGTSVEELHGQGEKHLGNTRQIFERHYLCRTSEARLPAAIK